MLYTMYDTYLNRFGNCALHVPDVVDKSRVQTVDNHQVHESVPYYDRI